ncbi:MAG: DUF447 domain-containing protein [Halobacteriales archaeon]
MDGPGDGDARDGTGEERTDGWPVDLRGVTETLVATRGPEGLWNVAALGVHAGNPATARTWGRTRTRRNFSREGSGVVQFTRDPVLFAEAALGVVEREEPVLAGADAWVEVDAESIDSGESGGTSWEEWALDPGDSGIRRRVVPATNRGYYAVVEATVAASRLGVEAYESAELIDRLTYFAGVVERCGGPREREAIEVVGDLTDGWEYDGA